MTDTTAMRTRHLEADDLLSLAEDRPGDAAAALLEAVRAGDAPGVRRLLEAGADADTSDPADLHRTALHLAVAGGALEVARALLEAGAPVNALDDTEESALTVALRFNHADAARLLLEHGAGRSGIARQGRFFDMAPLHLAAWHGNLELLRQFAHAPGADLEVTDSHGNTPLLVALLEGKRDAALFLLAQGVDVNGSTLQPGFEGMTALHIAVKVLEDLEIVRLLLRNGADPNARDLFGRTAQDLARGTILEDVLARPIRSPGA